MKYNLQQLGPTGFQDLASALAIATFGSGVQVMGRGPDGGRDLYHRGQLLWQSTDGGRGEVWDGYTVLQVKHKAELASRPNENTSWLWGQIRAELDRWVDPESARATVPDHLVIITNVPLTAAPGSGGHDQINSRIKSYAAQLADSSRDAGDDAKDKRKARLARISRLRRWRIWDGHQVQALLEVHGGVRRAFPGFLTAADVFANLAEVTDCLPVAELEPGLRAHARATLAGDGFVYFDEAGSGDGVGIPVHEVAIDLPVVRTGGPRTTVIRHVLDHAEHVLRPSVTTVPLPRHVILTGAPGNGKTTIAKFLIQVFRAAMLNGGADMSADQNQCIGGTNAALARFGRALPNHRRWAMSIDLAEYAQEGGLAEDSTLLKWIAHKVSRRSDVGAVKPSALRSWMRQWPWFLVLDGLDEVTEPAVRKRLIRQVTEFVNEAEATDCDVFVVLTTRPIGYTENIAPNHFDRVDLDYLEPQDALRYGTLATKVRLRADLDRIERVVRLLKRAAEDEAFRNLLRTPLQVLIVTIILDASGHLAPDRYSLFWGYYDTVFRRERDKQGGLHRMLQDHAQQVQLLHERVGFELQVRSECGDRSSAILTGEELKQVTWQVLDDAGFKPSGADANLLDRIITAATQRLVLLAPRGEAGYGFDVRSLQELMAAKHLSTEPAENVLERLRRSAASPHWRNTWIFAAGGLFATPQRHRHEAVVSLIEGIDAEADGRLGRIVPIGPRLALEIIDDGMARNLPVFRDRLMRHGLRVLGEPAGADLPTLTRILVRFAGTGDGQRQLVADGLRDALGNGPTARASVEHLQTLIPALADELGAGVAVAGLTGVRRHPGAAAAGTADPADGWNSFEAELATHPAAGQAGGRLDEAAEAMRRIRHDPRVAAADVDALADAFGDQHAANALAAALAHVVDHEPELVRVLRDEVLPTLYRRPIGPSLRPDPP